MTPNDSANTPKLFKILIPIAIILVAVVGTLFLIRSKLNSAESGSSTASSQSTTPGKPITEGSVLPNFEIKKFPDGTLVHASDLKSKVTLINFWATWCEACMVEMPSIIKLRETYKARGFDVVAVNVDDDPQSEVPATLKTLPGELPVYRDLDDAPLAELFDVHAIPLSIVMDQNRKVLMIETGERDWNSSNTKALIEKWLSQ